MSDSSDFEGVGNDMFQEPEGYFQPEPEPKAEVFERIEECVESGSPASIKVNLLGSHPLWGHYLWNAAKLFANYLDTRKDIVRGKTVVEFGAAGALPSLISACNGASRVVITDYPDPDLVGNIRQNVECNFPEKLADGSICVEGFKWGCEMEKIASLAGPAGTFDVLILSDLVFNHSEHTALLSSCKNLITKPGSSGTGAGSDGGEAYVFFTHHRPWLAEKDMEFIQRAQSEFGFDVERVVEEYVGPMFDDDPGDERVRGTVHGFRLTLKKQ
ncbi:Protein N-terminal and lysine N-methyltransferase efm7 [Dipsacomyces acuminosporus]|nr:Protein N-terminal and lysine N-methyltransferase efm7 [Dipsacomyces acuminosporus]